MVRTVTVIPQRKKLYSVSVEQKHQKSVLRHMPGFRRIVRNNLQVMRHRLIITRNSYRKMKTGSL